MMSSVKLSMFSVSKYNSYSSTDTTLQWLVFHQAVHGKHHAMIGYVSRTCSLV
jgi:hypothetical protein